MAKPNALAADTPSRRFFCTRSFPCRFALGSLLFFFFGASWRPACIPTPHASAKIILLVAPESQHSIFQPQLPLLHITGRPIHGLVTCPIGRSMGRLLGSSLLGQSASCSVTGCVRCAGIGTTQWLPANAANGPNGADPRPQTQPQTQPQTPSALLVSNCCVSHPPAFLASSTRWCVSSW